MDIRTMQYYLAVVREGTISAAAEFLHVAQPSLSRQMKDLEDELGTTLFIRGNRKIALTEEGMILRKRAEEIVHLMQMTQEEILQTKSHISGAVRIGAGESRSFHFLSSAACQFAREYPDVQFQIISGDTRDILDELDHGLIDFAVIFSDVDHVLYHSIRLPEKDRFGVLMRKDHPLSEKKEVFLNDLKSYPLILSRGHGKYFSEYGGFSGLNIAGTYNLIYNASLLVEDGLGLAISLEGLINTTGDSPLTFRILVPEVCVHGSLIWKKYQILSPAVQMFVNRLTSNNSGANFQDQL